MLNVKAVQKALGTFESWASFRAARDEVVGWNVSIADIPFTCSMAEINQPLNEKELAWLISEALENYKSVLCNTNSENSKKILRKFGFKEVGSFMGNHKQRVYTYILSLDGVKF